MLKKLVVALFLVALAPTAAWAQTTIKITSGPTACGSTVTASGSFTLACGRSVSGITLYLVGCQSPGAEAACSYDSVNLTWSASVSCVQSGSYTVFARITTLTLGDTPIDSAFATLTVP